MCKFLFFYDLPSRKIRSKSFEKSRFKEHKWPWSNVQCVEWGFRLVWYSSLKFLTFKFKSYKIPISDWFWTFLSSLIFLFNASSQIWFHSFGERLLMNWIIWSSVCQSLKFCNEWMNITWFSKTILFLAFIESFSINSLRNFENLM